MQPLDALQLFRESLEIDPTDVETQTLLEQALRDFKNPTLVVTVPIVFFAVMHYKRLVVFLHFGEEPERIVLRDLRLQLSILLWLITYFGVLYGNIHLFRSL